MSEDQHEAALVYVHSIRGTVKHYADEYTEVLSKDERALEHLRKAAQDRSAGSP